MRPNKPDLIKCHGTPYEIGRQYGDAAKSNIFKSVDFMFNSLEKGIFKAPREGVLKAANRYLDNVREFDPGAIEWVRGIADGSGISFETSFALKSYLEIAMSYPQITGTGMCTSFALTGPATENGLTMLGQNIDWHPDTPIDLLHISHADGVEQLCICFLGNFTYYLNSAGFGNCSNLTLSPMGPIKKHIPLFIYLWKAMRQKNMDQALDILKKTSRGLQYCHLADKSGNMSGIESVYDDYTVLPPENHLLVHANHYETEKYKKDDLAYAYIQDSFQRADRLRELISGSFGAITIKQMMAFLSDHQNYPNSVCRHVDRTKPPEMASMSKGSFIMAPEELKIYIAFGPPCENPFWEYSLAN